MKDLSQIKLGEAELGDVVDYLISVGAIVVAPISTITPDDEVRIELGNKPMDVVEIEGIPTPVYDNTASFREKYTAALNEFYRLCFIPSRVIGGTNNGSGNNSNNE